MCAAPWRPIVEWGRGMVDLIYPPVCPICFRRLTAEDHEVCYECAAQLEPVVQWQCERCGAQGIERTPEAGRRCHLCPPQDASWRGAWSVTGYGNVPARCVQLFKYHGRFEMGRLMARLMAGRLADSMASMGGRLDVIAPVPLHLVRRWTRGFNQSELLAGALAMQSGLPMDRRLLRRKRYTRRQALMARERRQENVAGAFALRRGRDVNGKGILLVDDVVTSGYTINECARVLREAGAREVWVACFARVGM